MSVQIEPDLTAFDSQIKRLIEHKLKERGAKLATQMMADYTKSIHDMFREVTASVCLELFRLIQVDRAGSELRIVIQDKTTETK